MSLFVCDECNVVENTATSGFWLQMYEQRDTAREERRYFCSLCDPAIRAWHGWFPRTEWDGQRQMLNRELSGEAA